MAGIGVVCERRGVSVTPELLLVALISSHHGVAGGVIGTSVVVSFLNVVEFAVEGVEVVPGATVEGGGAVVLVVLVVLLFSVGVGGCGVGTCPKLSSSIR